MVNVQRTRVAFQAWRDHLITAREAMEISGADSERDLVAIGQILDFNGSDEQPKIAE